MDIISAITHVKPLIFTKMGDGEYYAATYKSGANCDNTPYSRKLGDMLNDSFKYLSRQPNVFLAKWYKAEVSSYFESLVSHPVPWVPFESLIMRNADPTKINIYKAIRNASQHKIYICNNTIQQRAKELLNIDTFITIDPHNWFEVSFEDTLTKVLQSIPSHNNTIILISAGMGAKPLIAEIHKKYPNIIILDIGSALDGICSSKPTRDYHHGLRQYNDSIIEAIMEPQTPSSISHISNSCRHSRHTRRP